MRIPSSAMLPTLALLAAFGFYAAGFGLKAWADCLYTGSKTSEEFCDFYANSVMLDVDRNVRSRCGFSGARWSPDREMHRKWCLGLNGNQALPCTEHQARSVALDDCSAWCRKYSAQAYGAAVKNDDLNCGFTGPRWSVEMDDHIRWCQFVGTHAQADAETAARSAALADCVQKQTANKKRLDELGGVSKPRPGFDPSMKKP
jgi:hypothetical protein